MTTHRGALHPDEYDTLDHDIVRDKVEAHLGSHIRGSLRGLRHPGRPSADQTQKRSQIDSALLGLSRSGGNMIALARVFGWEIEVGARGERCKKMERALARTLAPQYEKPASRPSFGETQPPR